MDAFRSMLTGWVGKSLLVLISVPFVIVGIEGIFTSGRDRAALVVDDHEISNAEIQQAVENRRTQILEQLGKGVDPSFITAEMVRPAVEQELIKRQLLIGFADKDGFSVPEEAAKSYVRAVPQFQTPAGEFSQPLLNSYLSRAGITAKGLLNNVSTSLLTEQIQGGLGGSAFATPADVERILSLDKQVRDIGVAYIKPEEFRAGINPSDFDLTEYYEAHQDDYQSEERVKVSYVHLSQEQFAANDEPISDAEIQDKLDEMIKDAEGNERRHAEHILFETGSKHSDAEARSLAEKALAELKAGKNFEELAKAQSEDFESAKNGGDLGYAGRGVYAPEFEDALFALQAPNDISGVVKTEFGYHIIKLIGVDEPPLPDMQKSRDHIIAEIRKERIASNIGTIIDDIDRMAFESNDLSEISAQYDQKPEVSDWLTRKGGTGIFADPKVVEAAFSSEILQEQRNSDVIELEDGSLVVLRMDQHEPVRELSLDEVKDKVREQVIASKAQELATEQAKELLGRLNAGEDRVAVLASAKLFWQDSPALARNATMPPQAVVQKAFELPKPAAGKYSNTTLPLASGEIALISVSNVVSGDGKAKSEAEQRAFQNGLAMRYGSMDMEGFLSTLESKAVIKRNQNEAEEPEGFN
ncbi:Peptidyl-prolyl cis-trans isomerase D [gamma proteobacterium HdN1]|nr:Peptidyl-prolyl cis-trans isomerase D [gamma proteobacterium HdN1]